MKRCPFCTEEIQNEAIICKHCGRNLLPIAAPAQRLWHPGIAAVLSLVIPGAGQMYKGSVVKGIAWLIFTVLGYLAFIIPGVILHLMCIISATWGDPYRQD